MVYSDMADEKIVCIDVVKIVDGGLKGEGIMKLEKEGMEVVGVRIVGKCSWASQDGRCLANLARLDSGVVTCLGCQFRVSLLNINGDPREITFPGTCGEEGVLRTMVKASTVKKRELKKGDKWKAVKGYRYR